jgi:hypothetical protein
MSIISDKKRLVLEHYAMRQRWGDGPRWCCNADKTVFWWEYDLRLEGNVFRLRVVYPPDYPASPPELILTSPLPNNTPHLWPQKRTVLPGPRLCWFHPSGGRSRNVWNPAADTAAMAIGVAYRWCLAFTVWMTTAQWPVPDATSDR